MTSSPMTSLPFFIYFFTLFIVGKKCYSIPPLKKCEMDTTSIKDLSFFPQLNTKKGEKIKYGTRIFRANLNVSQKATQEKTNYKLRGGISSNTYYKQKKKNKKWRITKRCYVTVHVNYNERFCG